MLGKSRKCGVFSMIRGSGRWKSRLAKAAGAEVAVQRRHEKLHAAVARSTFASQNVQNTPAPNYFLKFRCRKRARRCSEKDICKSKCSFGPFFEVGNCTPLWKRILKSKCAKHTMLGPPFEVQMSKRARRCSEKDICKSKCTKHTSAPVHF